MGSFPAGFPFISWNFFTKVKLKSNSFNSCTIYIIPSAVQCPSRVNEETQYSGTEAVVCPHSLSQTPALTLLLALPRAGEGSCAGAFRRSSVCVRRCERGNTGDAAFQQFGVHSQRQISSLSAKTLPPSIPWKDSAYPEKSITKKDGNSVLPNTTKHCVLEQTGACLLRKGASEKLG